MASLLMHWGSRSLKEKWKHSPSVMDKKHINNLIKTNENSLNCMNNY